MMVVPAWHCFEPRLALNRIVVVRYRDSRRPAARARSADCGLMSADLAAGIQRVKGARQLGHRSGNWLNLEQSPQLVNCASGDGLRERRDCAMLAILVGCGLRRAELASLPVEKIQIRKGHWGIVDLVGKDGHVRTIPIPRWAKEKLDRWTSAAMINTGRVCRAIPKNGTGWGDRINENVVWHVVNRYCRSIGLEHVAPA
jgi:site-specific recombinase XerC